ncbi:MAG: hypothetical protein M1830_003785 [Pleopsidium flavum]|nr:MAG: hypothetical protein M1830_003785 [Pleopsidium flavum]
MAINGSAVGVGMTMTLPAAIRIAAAPAKCGFVFARRGIVMEASSSYFLPRLIGYSKAIHLTTTGLTYPATSPLLADLFSEVLPTPAEVLPRALELAQDIAQNTSAVSTYLMRQMMWRNPGTAESTHLLDSRLLYELFSSSQLVMGFMRLTFMGDDSDKNEGIKSFFEKRPPNFQGTMQQDAPGAYPWWQAVDVRSRAKANTEVKSKL